MNNEIQLRIQNGNTVYTPAVEGNIVWETERKGVPGKLSFNVVKDGVINFQEGNHVSLSVNGTDLFYGFAFTKKRDKKGVISVTAYDQLRYFKNKDTYSYRDKTADELLRMIAEASQLKCGSIESTGYKIAQRMEDNKALFDMILNALDLTLQSTGKLYVLYDDYGSLTLRNIENMKLDALISSDTAEDFDYTTSIDGQTYNQIKLYRENQAAGKREIYITKHGKNIGSWGLLQLYEKLEEKENGSAKADALLSLYNKKTRDLSVRKAFGDLRVRGGSSIPVSLDLGDIVANTYMVVEKVRHTINDDSHFMDVTFWGGF